MDRVLAERTPDIPFDQAHFPDLPQLPTFTLPPIESYELPGLDGAPELSGERPLLPTIPREDIAPPEDVDPPEFFFGE
ncbi:MAG TPA: hypothetical protein VFX16_23250 [Pseudonocardiaceae bacterium]|nr:hypothetical protein [Pseudonocardiaceae bacterium]